MWQWGQKIWSNSLELGTVLSDTGGNLHHHMQELSGYGDSTLQ